jgi:hypothetical protein
MVFPSTWRHRCQNTFVSPDQPLCRQDGLAQFAVLDGSEGNRASEKRKVGGSTPPLTTNNLWSAEMHQVEPWCADCSKRAALSGLDRASINLAIHAVRHASGARPGDYPNQ